MSYPHDRGEREIAVDFDWNTIYESESSGSLPRDTIEDMKHLLLFMAGYIFLPNPNGGQRHDRATTISTKATAAFALLLRKYVGDGDMLSLFRLSGINTSKSNFYQHVEAFDKYIHTTTGSICSLLS